MSRLTCYHLLLPHTILVVHQTESLDVVAVSNQVVHHLLDGLLAEQGLAALQI